MNEPGRKGSNTLLWVVLAVVGSCGGCGLLTAAVMFLGFFTTEGSTAPRTTTTTTVVTAKPSRIATGNTPDLFPGSVGWLPSGHGVEIPEARVREGRLEGLWWRFQTQGNGTSNAQVILFLQDGTRATNPRPGRGVLFDLKGQRAQRGTTGLGTFDLGEGTITQHHDGFDSTDPLTWGDGDDGQWISIGKSKYGELQFVAADELIGTWVANGSKFVFRGDGTYESGQIVDTGDFAGTAGLKGTYVLEGYLLEVRPTGAPGWITTVARGHDLLLIGTTVYAPK